MSKCQNMYIHTYICVLMYNICTYILYMKCEQNKKLNHLAYIKFIINNITVLC